MNGLPALCPPSFAGRTISWHTRTSFSRDRSGPLVRRKGLPFVARGVKEFLDRTAIAVQLIKLVCGLLGLLAVPEIIKNFLYPAASPVQNLHRRLKQAGRKRSAPIIMFNLKPYQQLTEDRALILQGRNQEGKTTLLRESIPWYRRFGPLAFDGTYLNGAEGRGVDSFEKWQTTQMFGLTMTAGSEIKYTLVQYRNKQWIRGVLEGVGLPIAPKPAIVLVDQFEELLKRYPVQALDWANTLTNQHTRDGLARVIFVCNSDAGSKTLLNLNQGTRFDRMIMEQASGEGVVGLDKEFFKKSRGNIGMYKLMEKKIKRQELTMEQVDDEVKKTFERWERDFHVPYPMKYDGSWADLSSVQRIKYELEETLELALRAKEKDDGKKDYTEEEVKERMTFAKKTWRDLNQQQILDAPEEEWASMLMSGGAEKAVAKALASEIKGIIGNPIPNPANR